MSHIIKMFEAIIRYFYLSSRTLYKQPLYFENVTKKKVKNKNKNANQKNTKQTNVKKKKNAKKQIFL